jgi:hypothetical protein
MDTYYEFKCSCIYSNVQGTPYFMSGFCVVYSSWLVKKIPRFCYFKGKQNTWYLYLTHVHT